MHINILVIIKANECIKFTLTKAAMLSSVLVVVIAVGVYYNDNSKIKKRKRFSYVGSITVCRNPQQRNA